MEFKDVAQQLNRQEMEDLLTEAFAPRTAGPFVVESIKKLDDKKEVQIRYMGTTTQRTITVGGHDAKTKATSPIQ